MKTEFKVDRSKSQHDAHYLSSQARPGAVEIVHDGGVYDNVANPLAYAMRIFASNPDANVKVRFGSKDYEYPIVYKGGKVRIVFPWS
tara:strand:+ start:14684 stop:14944 length:261 start_codon:yes stop_codon:yes gene_type:complete